MCVLCVFIIVYTYIYMHNCKLTHAQQHLLKAPSLALQSLDDFKLQRFSKLDCTLAKSYPLHSPTWRRLQAKTLQTLWLFQDPSNPVTLQRLFKPLHSNPPVFSAAASSAESACASWMASKTMRTESKTSKGKLWKQLYLQCGVLMSWFACWTAKLTN